MIEDHKQEERQALLELIDSLEDDELRTAITMMVALDSTPSKYFEQFKLAQN